MRINIVQINYDPTDIERLEFLSGNKTLSASNPNSGETTHIISNIKPY
jgi:hypothetical protein